jgi:hypothetical protein
MRTLVFKEINPEEMGGTCETHADYDICEQKLVQNIERKRLLGRPTIRCKYNIKLDLE